MNLSSTLALLLLLLTALPSLAEEKKDAAATAKAAKTKKKQSSYVRTTKDDDGKLLALQTSIREFHSIPGADGPSIQVDLIGAIHVGEGDYYADLNRRFRGYDAVLYELIAPEGTRIPAGGGSKSESAVSYLQTGMTSALGLEYQLEKIDYQLGNLVHADMTPEEFAASIKKKKESIAKVFFRSIGQAIVQQSRGNTNGTSNMKMLSALMSENREFELRTAMAEQFANMDGAMVVFGGKDGSTIITERNKKALSVLKREINNGRRKLGIFYGAGHMEDMAKRLEKDFQLKPGKTVWLDAWNLESE
jgi:hypothetical protein